MWNGKRERPINEKQLDIEVDEITVPLRSGTILLEEEEKKELLLNESFQTRALSGYSLLHPLAQDGPRPLKHHATSSPPDRCRVKLLLVRHAESEANVDPMVHTRLADHIIPLSAKGRTEALACGTFLAEYFSSSLSTTEEAWQRRIIVSPYKRARETASAIVQSAGQFIGDITESVLAGEQQFGLFEGLPVSKIASVFPLENRYFEKAIASGGRFWARPPLGESRFDVCVRASSIIDMILHEEHYFGINTFIVVSHGITLRALAMMWLGRTPEWFEAETNPANCSVRLLEGTSDRGYIFSGSPRASGAATIAATTVAPTASTSPTLKDSNKKDVVDARVEAEDDPLTYTQRTMTSVSSASSSAIVVSKENLAKRLAELEEEIAEIKAALERDL